MKKFFTLTELLISIAIIVILAAILVPVVGSAIGKAEVAKGKTQISTLMTAIKMYESTYGKLPIPDGYDDVEVIEGDCYTWLIELLQGQESLTGSATYGTQAKKNPRKMQFLDIVDNNPGRYKDPWDNDYFVILDKTHKGKMVEPEIPGVNHNGWKSESSRHVFYYPIVIWSKGPDGELDKDTRTNGVNEDNIYSFNTGWRDDSGHTVQP